MNVIYGLLICRICANIIGKKPEHTNSNKTHTQVFFCGKHHRSVVLVEQELPSSKGGRPLARQVDVGDASSDRRHARASRSVHPRLAADERRWESIAGMLVAQHSVIVDLQKDG